MVGLGDVFQHRPLSVTGTPPSDTIFPPDCAEFPVMTTTIVVVNDTVLTGVTGAGGGSDFPQLVITNIVTNRSTKNFVLISSFIRSFFD
jgi:hypothetical protein